VETGNGIKNSGPAKKKGVKKTIKSMNVFLCKAHVGATLRKGVRVPRGVNRKKRKQFLKVHQFCELKSFQEQNPRGEGLRKD